MDQDAGGSAHRRQAQRPEVQKLNIEVHVGPEDVACDGRFAATPTRFSPPFLTGEYITARAISPPHRGSVKIIAEPDHFVVNVSLWSREPDMHAVDAQFAAFRELLFSRRLPAIGAHSLTPTDDYE